MTILVRFNQNAIGEHDRWRFVREGVEHTCASVTFHCPSETCHHEMAVDGQIVSKWHIRPIQPSKIEVIENETGRHFIVH
ncbi:MAG: hypothetical protein ACK478_03850 [Flavobacteriales bacterium]